jgi:hypothetical protein
MLTDRVSGVCEELSSEISSKRYNQSLVFLVLNFFLAQFFLCSAVNYKAVKRQIQLRLILSEIKY